MNFPVSCLAKYKIKSLKAFKKLDTLCTIVTLVNFTETISHDRFCDFQTSKILHVIYTFENLFIHDFNDFARPNFWKIVNLLSFKIFKYLYRSADIDRIRPVL